MNASSSLSSPARAFLELGANLVLPHLERKKDDFRIDSAKVGAITRSLKNLPHDEIHAFRSPKGRDDFLFAATEYLSKLHSHEELVVGIGTRRGPARHSGSRLTHVYRAVGDRGSVKFTPTFMNILQAQAARERGDLIVMHNHPRALWKTALGELFGDWRPVASTQDRATATRHLLERLPKLGHARSPSVRWYLVDEGRLAEFWLPPITMLLDAVNGLAQFRQSTSVHERRP